MWSSAPDQIPKWNAYIFNIFPVKNEDSNTFQYFFC